ncbi:hypothetical protein [Sphingobium yanoikuyae]|uniref:hypothetical protein n=1 Tax=Sphingobium yanoikuyae TaxID=13690 RepID=UPI00241FB6C0|nr:hypothetical protein [Sphingobium yanoikuyae]
MARLFQTKPNGPEMRFLNEVMSFCQTQNHPAFRGAQLLGIVPTNSGGFGDVTKVTDAFFELEIEPL